MPADAGSSRAALPMTSMHTLQRRATAAGALEPAATTGSRRRQMRRRGTVEPCSSGGRVRVDVVAPKMSLRCLRRMTLPAVPTGSTRAHPEAGAGMAVAAGALGPGRLTPDTSHPSATQLPRSRCAHRVRRPGPFHETERWKGVLGACRASQPALKGWGRAMRELSATTVAATAAPGAAAVHGL